MRRAKSFTVTGLFAGSALALAGWSQNWFEFSVAEGVGPTLVMVSGIQSLGAVSAIAFGVMAAATVLLIATTFWRYVVASISLGISAVGFGLIWQALAEPLRASVGSLSLATGVASVGSIQALLESSIVTAWPAVALGGFSIAIVASLFGLVTMWAWPQATRRFNRPEIQLENSRSALPTYADGEAWDVLSHGADPTQSD